VSALVQLQYPGRIIESGEADDGIVKALQQQLNSLGCGLIEEDGAFGPDTRSAVRLFQARFPAPAGGPLSIDGRVGPLTWAVLFGPGTVPTFDEAPAPLLGKAVEVARGQLGVMEEPRGSNRGPQVDAYVRSVAIDPRSAIPWCMAFVYWAFLQAATGLGRDNPVVRTGGALEHWRQAGRRGIPRIPGEEAAANPGLVRPGMIFLLSTGGGRGHGGIVTRVHGGTMRTIEGNTTIDGSRAGIGVYERDGRKLADANLGFVDYSRL
jgi:hypothetical protein